MESILKSYLRRLTNLSGNNHSLNLLRLSVEQFLDLHALDFALNKSSFELIESLIADESKIALCQEMDSRDKSSNLLAVRLKKLNRRDQFIFQERGARDLYVGWPFIRGKFSDETIIRCPLLFFPVELQVENGKWMMHPRQNVNITLNKTFLLAYAHYNQVKLDEELVERIIDDFDPDSTIYRTQLYELLKSSNLEIHFNQENFTDKLHPFKNFKKADLDKSEKPGVLKLYPEAVLGIFPQAGSHLVPDYVQLLENDHSPDMEEFFTRRVKLDPEDESMTKYSDRVLEENTFTPFAIDAYQEQALNKIKKGNSINIQGPPGTGKSQLIANIISDFIARGKNVLLVCQKRAALDVVFGRLKEQDIHDFVGMVHDFKNDRKTIFDKLESQISRLEEYQRKNNSLDSIQIERAFTQSSRRIAQHCEELEEFKSALFDESECGKSIKELYLNSDVKQPHVRLKQDYHSFRYEGLAETISRLETYFSYHNAFEHKNHFWSKGLPFDKYESADRNAIEQTVRDAVMQFQEFQARSDQELHKTLDFDTVDYFLNQIKSLRQLISNLDNKDTYRYFSHLRNNAPNKDLSWIVELERTMLNCFKGSGPEISLSSSELGRFQEALQQAIQARKNPLKWIKWKLFSKYQVFVTRVLVSNELKSNKEGFKVLLERIDNRLNLEHNISLIESQSWLIGFPKNHRKIDIQNWFFHQRLAYKTLELFKALRSLDAYVKFKHTERKLLITNLNKFAELIELFPDMIGSWKIHLTNNQIRELLSDRVKIDEVIDELSSDFENLRDYHLLKSSMSSSERSLIEILLERGGSTSDMIQCFHNSLALEWIEHIESKHPILRLVSTMRYQQILKELRESNDQKRSLSKDILLLRSREKTYDKLEFNRLNNLVTYRDLLHQVTKKRRIWPLRRVISEFSEEVFKLIPCWMVSPESASAIFPMEELFDLVIFDEASQCFAERGIPAMYRGKQVVVAGDAMQLKPFDLYRAKWEDENEDIPELEIDSLLDLTERYLPKTHLQGHYRSKSLELIEFSNQHFYKGRLKLMPHRAHVNAKTPSIHYEKVNGFWENNINIEEAKQVVALIGRLSKKWPEKQIGVVTFNMKQRDLIMDLIDIGSKNWGKIPEGLFVKNIENVQGDERDIIIFSTAYAKDKSGKLQLKFGSLNTPGGENRLNVAVTRARDEVYVVTSLEPEELDTSRTKNQGPKLLEAYLHYAKRVATQKWQPSVFDGQEHLPGWYLKSSILESFEFPASVEFTDQMPFADLTAKFKNEYLGVLLTDDQHFHQAPTIKDQFLYKPEIFNLKGWPMIQVFSRNLWENPEKVEDDLRLFYNKSQDH
ncbi:MAG: DUF4011 domain-containing protein [Cyclobacteriaceae bacterium]